MLAAERDAMLALDERHWWYRGRRRIVLGFAERLGLPAGCSILDAGCGSGRTMRDLILGHSTDLTSLPWVGHHTRNWEPEPIRFVASRLIHKALESADAYEERTGKAARRARLVAPFLPPA